MYIYIYYTDNVVLVMLGGPWQLKRDMKNWWIVWVIRRFAGCIWLLHIRYPYAICRRSCNLNDSTTLALLYPLITFLFRWSRRWRFGLMGSWHTWTKMHHHSSMSRCIIFAIYFQKDNTIESNPSRWVRDLHPARRSSCPLVAKFVHNT